MLQCVSRVIMVTVVQAFAAKTVSSPEFVTGLQAIVMEDVEKDGREANVINVKLCFFKVLYITYIVKVIQ